ncbi:helix-turn-helix domain-containing protein [Nocardia sp. FDAARGOS_372]|uniref:helix-turn-helix domain-containing protein n=1 Tax=Nocardia sp. FDAARGOS_372 TaxID=2018066 RepID=UPI001562A4E8|nr:helix-turn-helix domain-containing protein [Nocardia sp. FDAARGOS_372]
MSTRTLTLREVAAKYGVHVNTARRWAACGELPAQRIGRSYYVNPDDLDNWRKPDDLDNWRKPAPEPPAHASARTDYAEYIARVVAQAPPLTPEQVDRLTALLAAAAAPSREMARSR